MPSSFVRAVQRGKNKESNKYDNIGENEFQESSSHRWAGLIIILYMLAGATSFYFIEKDHLKHWADSLYFIVLTLTTVGYGDIVPMSDNGKIFMVVYMFFGLSFVAACFGMVANKLAGLFESQLLPGEQSLKTRLGQLLLPLGIVAGNMSCAVLVIHYNEGVDWVTAIYWSMVSLSSVGYGDPLITKESTRIFLTVYLLWGVTSVVWALGKIASVFSQIDEFQQLNSFVKDGLMGKLNKEMNRGKHCGISRDDFVTHMLIKLGKVSQTDVSQLKEIYENFDHGASIDHGPSMEAEGEMSIAEEGEISTADKNA